MDKRKQKKEKLIGVRVTKEEFNKIKLNANVYTQGNVSEWIALAALKFKPKGLDIV